MKNDKLLPALCEIHENLIHDKDALATEKLLTLIDEVKEEIRAETIIVQIDYGTLKDFGTGDYHAR